MLGSLPELWRRDDLLLELRRLLGMLLRGIFGDSGAASAPGASTLKKSTSVSDFRRSSRRTSRRSATCSAEVVRLGFPPHIPQKSSVSVGGVTTI